MGMRSASGVCLYVYESLGCEYDKANCKGWFNDWGKGGGAEGGKGGEEGYS